MADKEMTRAGFGPRAAAYIIDRAVLFVALGFVRLPVWIASWLGGGQLTEKSFLFNHSALDVIAWVLISAYFVLLTYFGGSTLGKMVMRLHVQREDGAELRFIDALYRETVGRFLSGILCLGYFMVLVDRRHRSFADWLCGTCVVYDEVAFRRRDGRTREPAAGWTPAAPADADPAAAAPAQALPGPGWSLPGESGGEAAEPAAEEEGEA